MKECEKAHVHLSTPVVSHTRQDGRVECGERCSGKEEKGDVTYCWQLRRAFQHEGIGADRIALGLSITLEFDMDEA